MSNVQQPAKPLVQVRLPGNYLEWAEVRTLCCLTGGAGDPIEQERWSFFGELWVGPYQRLRPEWTYVAVQSGQVVGYLTGCPDTEWFEREKLWYFDLPLMLSVGFGRYARQASDVARFVRRRLGLERGPERFFSSTTLSLLREQYPAHLHVNVAAGLRGAGLGARLTEVFSERLRAEGVKGIHVYCGKKPVKFYERLGFATLEKIDYQSREGARTVEVFAMGLSLSTKSVRPAH